MTDDDRLRQVLRSACPPVVGEGPSHDVWPLLVNRIQAPATVAWVWLDASLAAVVTIVLLIFPEYLSLLAYHL